MSTFYGLYVQLAEKDPSLADGLTRDHFFPTDKMNVEAVEKIFKWGSLNFGKVTDTFAQTAKECQIYCQHALMYYHAWTYSVESQDLKTKQQNLGICKQYFSSIGEQLEDLSDVGTVSEGLLYQIQTSVDCFSALLKYCSEKGYTLPMTSHLSTNVVELHFSLIRSKFRYPDAVQYMIISDRVWHEQLKRCAIDRKFTYPDTEISKCYNNTHGMKTLMEECKLWSRKKKKKIMQK